MNRVLAMVALVCSLNSCATSFQRLSTTDRQEITVAALSEALADHDFARYDAFVRWDALTKPPWQTDPPPFVLKSLRARFPVLPSSQAVWIEISKDDNLNYVANKHSKKRGKIYFVDIVRVGFNHIVIDVGFAAEGLFGGSTEYVARKTRDGWRFEPTGTVSVS